MATIQYAVLVFRDGKEPQVGHLYQHRADAETCADAYAAQLGLKARAVSLAPPLAVARRADVWAALEDLPPGELAELRVHATLEAAGGHPLLAPIRGGMPTQKGIPQFVMARPRALLPAATPIA